MGSWMCAVLPQPTRDLQVRRRQEERDECRGPTDAAVLAECDDACRAFDSIVGVGERDYGDQVVQDVIGQKLNLLPAVDGSI